MSRRFGRPGTLALVLAIWISGATGTVGCKRLFKKKTTTPDGGVTASAVDAGTGNTPQDDLDEQMQDKIDNYIICLNTLSSPVHATRARYFSWVNPKTGPTGKEPQILGLFDLPNDTVKTCTEGAAKSKIMPPRDAKLEDAADDFAKAVTDLDAILDDVFDYYENKSYKDDKLAKGKAAHPKLIAAFNAFSKADNNLHTALDAITKPLAQRALARIEREEGKKFRYHRKHVLIEARELVEAGDPVGADDYVDFPLYTTEFNDLDAALTDLQTYTLAHKTDLDPASQSNLDAFTRAADDYRKKAREYLRCLRDSPAKAKMPNNKVDPERMGACPDGRPRDVVSKYNDFIHISNDHQFP